MALLDPRAMQAAIITAGNDRRKFPCAAGAWHGRGLVCYAS